MDPSKPQPATYKEFLCPRRKCSPVELEGDDGARRNETHLLGGARGGNGHEEHDGDEAAAALAHEVDGGGGRDEAGTRLGGGHGQVERDGGEANGGGERKGDGEPAQPTEEVACNRIKQQTAVGECFRGSKIRTCNQFVNNLKCIISRRLLYLSLTLVGGGGLGGNGGLPVGLVDEHCTEVTNNVNDAEREPFLGDHGEVRAVAVARHLSLFRTKGSVSDEEYW
eukprot:1181791-Prorocentrum_minimum.AAC.3